MADLAVRPHDPPLAAETLAGVDRGLHLVAHPLAIVGMDALEIAIERAGEFLARLHAENLVELVGPDDLVGLEIAHPASEVGEALRLDQVPRLLVEHGLGALAAVDLLLQARGWRAVSAAVRAATRRLRSSCTARSSSSVRRRTAASALSARLGTVTPIMNISSIRKDSLSVSRPNGPLPANVPQTAKPASMSATVAVSRGPRRSADHNSGSTARNPSGAPLRRTRTSD